jgi:class 3 adenylate cyclase
MDGRIAFARGDFSTAIDRLRQSLEAFLAADYGVEVMRTRRSLADVESAAKNPGAAEQQLRAAMQMADDREAIYEGTMARRALAALGVALDDPDVRVPASDVAVSERLVTVLFLDIRGYTTMSSEQPPERVVDTVASLYRWAGQEVARHHGVVDQHQGDAVMATFNVSGARLDHCLQALQAAIAIRDKAAAAGLPVGAGIAVGPAVVGKLTTASNVSTFGEVTNLASRLQAKAAPGEILLSEEAYRRTRDWLAEEEVPVTKASLELKGFAGSVTVYRLRALQTTAA